MHTARNFFVFSGLAAAILVFLLIWEPGAKTQSDETEAPLVFFCAAGIKPPVEAVAKKYREQYGVEVQLQYGGSGTLLNNLRVAKKGDLYLAADETYIELARERDLIDEIFPVAHIRPVIVVLKGNPKNIGSLDDLLRDDVSVGLANPDAASVGRVTKKLLEGTGHWSALQKRVRVFKPTVNDVANDVKIGTIDAGIVWDAVANQYPELETVSIPEGKEYEQQITLAVLKTSASPTAAIRFARYLTSRDQGLPEFAARGYEPVEGDIWEEVPKIVLFSGGVNRLAIEDTIEAFEEREGVEISRVYNGCGILVSQMKAGDIPDAYFACDVSFMNNVGDIFLDSVDVSDTDMVILTQKGNPHGIETMADLGKEGLKVGTANPEQSALGSLTKSLFTEAGVYEEIEPNIVTQTPTADLLVNQMRTGSLDAVIVYRANCPNVKDDLEILPIEHPMAKAVQPYAISRKSPHKHLMKRLLEAIQSERSKKIFEDVGFRWQGPLS